MYICYESYKGGTNNLIVAFDGDGTTGTSLIDEAHAVRNYQRALNKRIATQNHIATQNRIEEG